MIRMSSLLSRFQGSLVGAVIGDCIGAIFESQWAETIDPDKVAKAISKVETEAEKEEDYKIWEFTDDTAMTRSVARSLTENKGFDAEDMAERFAENYFDEPERGYGGSVASIFKQMKDSNYEEVFEPAKKQFDGQGSYGNGGAMRIAPAALFTYSQNDPAKLKDLVTQITSLTHTHEQAILGAVLQSYAIDMALNSSSSFSPEEMAESLIILMSSFEQEKPPGDGADQANKSDKKYSTYREKLELIKQYLKQDKEPSRLTIHHELGVDIAALDSVPAAVYSFLRCSRDIKGGFEDSNPFKRTVMYAISLGGDSDTVASMAGAIAGACYGLESIPKSWQKCCEGVDDAKDLAAKLLELQDKS